MRKSLINDLEQKLQIQNLFSWIEDAADQLSQLGVQPNGYIELTPELTSSRGIESIVNRVLPKNSHARIVPTENGYKIEVQPGLPPELRRFAIGHEIGHTLWFAPGGQGRALSSAQLCSNSDPDIEILSDRFSAALLLPKKTIQQFFPSDTTEQKILTAALDCIPELSTQFKVPERVFAERVVFDLYNINYIVFCVRFVRAPLKLALLESDIKKDYWQLSWLAIPHQARITTSQGELNVRGAWPKWRPRIPKDMIPEWAGSKAKEGLVDGRWNDLAKITLSQISRTLLKNLSNKKTISGHVRHINDRVFLALSLKDHYSN